MSATESLLALLESEPAHGYTLKRQYDRWFGRNRQLAFGQVYSTLARLEKNGLVSQSEVESGKGPDRRLYAITPDGINRLDEWVSTPQTPDLFATSSICARLTVALLSGRDAHQVLASQRQLHLDRMRELQERRRGAEGPDLLALTYEITHLDADLRWIEESGARLARSKRNVGGSDA